MFLQNALCGRSASNVRYSQSSFLSPGIVSRSGKALALTMTNTGAVSCTFTIGVNVAYLASGGEAQTVTVAAGGTATATLVATSAGRYDFTVTANTGDSFGRRFAGRLYAQ